MHTNELSASNIKHWLNYAAHEKNIDEHKNQYFSLSHAQFLLFFSPKIVHNIKMVCFSHSKKNLNVLPCTSFFPFLNKHNQRKFMLLLNIYVGMLFQRVLLCVFLVSLFWGFCFIIFCSFLLKDCRAFNFFSGFRLGVLVWGCDGYFGDIILLNLRLGCFLYDFGFN